jgi:hypothetical protein
MGFVVLVMKTLTNHQTVREHQGFAVYVLGNEDVELAVVPELGAKIVSLKNQRTQREWLWHPNEKMRLFKSHSHDDFSAGPLGGIDECLPTISPCSWQGRDLPDHGEVWNHAWQVNTAAWQNGILETSIQLKLRPFILKRTIGLHGNQVRLDYQLSNLGKSEESFIWALHPLLQLTDGDELELPVSTRKLLNGKAWIDDVVSVVPEAGCAKVFANPVTEGWAAIKNELAGDRLEFAWDPAENNVLGLWLTRGGWHGHHHFAIEPTNANDDSLVVAAGRQKSGSITGNSSLTWQLSLRVGLD